MWPGPFGAIMNTSMSGRGSISRKWMLSPCAKASAVPSRMFGRRFVVVEPGLQLVGRQHHDDVGPFRRLGLASCTLNPAFSAFSAEAEPGRSATTTSLTPLSRRLLAWAWPWLP